MRDRQITVSDAVIGLMLMFTLFLFVLVYLEVQDQRRAHETTQAYVSSLTHVMVEHGVPADHIPPAPWGEPWREKAED